MNKKTVIPKLRFPEFVATGEWDEHTLGDIAERITEKVGNRQLITLSISAGVGFVSQTEKFSRDISGNQYSNYIYLRKGELSYNKGNSKKFPQGCVYELTEYNEAAVPNAFISFRFFDGYVSDFYKGYFDNNFHGMQLKKFITSSARSDGLLNINPTDFFSIVLPTPQEEAEQQKIADCLSSLDDLIAVENKKLEALKMHKKGLMQKMFPVEGKTVPEIRFKGYADAWEQRNLVKVTTKIGSGKTPKGGSSVYVDNGIPLLRSQNINHDKVDLSDVAFISVEVDSEMKSSRVQQHDVLLNITGASIGRCAVYSFLENANVNQHVCIIRPNSETNAYFVQLNLSSDNGQQQIDNNQAGGGREGINFQQIGEIKFSFPSFSEQTTIGKFFRNLDEVIAAQAEKIEALKTHNKGLMQGLFPSAQEVFE
jgi:type I restriction enzyme S subunit